MPVSDGARVGPADLETAVWGAELATALDGLAKLRAEGRDVISG